MIDFYVEPENRQCERVQRYRACLESLRRVVEANPDYTQQQIVEAAAAGCSLFQSKKRLRSALLAASSEQIGDADALFLTKKMKHENNRCAYTINPDYRQA